MPVSNQRRRELYARNKIEHPERIQKRFEATKKWLADHPEMKVEYQKKWIEKKGIKQVRKGTISQS